jgi:hypothetical protein
MKMNDEEAARQLDRTEAEFAYARLEADELRRKAAADPDRGRPRIDELRRAGLTSLADRYRETLEAHLDARQEVADIAAAARTAWQKAEARASDLLEELERIDAQARAELGNVPYPKIGRGLRIPSTPPEPGTSTWTPPPPYRTEDE